MKTFIKKEQVYIDSNWNSRFVTQRRKFVVVDQGLNIEYSRYNMLRKELRRDGLKISKENVLNLLAVMRAKELLYEEKS